MYRIFDVLAVGLPRTTQSLFTSLSAGQEVALNIDLK